LELDINQIKYYADNSDITNADYETEGRIDFKSLKQELKYFFPLDAAFMESERDSIERDSEIRVRKRIIRRNGNRYLLAGVPLTWLKDLPQGTVIIDPQIAIDPEGGELKDAFVRTCTNPSYSYWATSNYGSNGYWYVNAWTKGGYPSKGRTYFQFDLSDIPSTARITSAEFFAYWNNTFVEHGTGIYSRYSISSTYIRRVTEAWDENTITWNDQPSSITTNQVIVPAPETGTSDFEIDITNLLIDALSSSEGYNGLLWQLQTESQYRSIYPAGNDHNDPGLHPKLEITYETLKKFFYLKDHLGNIRVTMNDQGIVKGYDDYYPFGKAMPNRCDNNANPGDLYK